MIESCTIITVRIRDAAGNPTCACNFATGEVCQYYRTQRMGCHETCIFAPGNGKHSAMLLRRMSTKGVAGDGTLIPGEWCPLWTQKEIEETTV